MKKQYVEKRADGGYWVADTRVSLDSLVYAFNRGESPEHIRSAFSVLTLEEVYGSLTFYLANHELIDKYLAESEIVFEAQAKKHHEELLRTHPEFVKRFMEAEVVAH